MAWYCEIFHDNGGQHGKSQADCWNCPFNPAAKLENKK